MKPFPLILTVALVFGIAILVWALMPEAPMPTTSSVRNSNSNSPSSPALTSTILDADGCFVIDLRNVPPTEHDRERRVYRWVVEHPADAACVRQFNPTIPEAVVESRTEKIRGTNNWQHEYYY